MRLLANNTIGVDVGGTRIRAARIGSGGQILARISEPSERQRDAFAAQLTRVVGALRNDATEAVGIGLPGRVDGPAQTIVSAGFLDIGGLDVLGLMAELGLPARIENDATMALIAEARGTAGLVLMATIGTGIGGAALLDGAPWYGGGFAGQFGHIAVSPDGPPCNCGRRGCVETFSSGSALGRLLAEAGWPEGTTAETLLESAENGDGAASALLTDWAAPLERALQSLVAVADPAQILIGGGLGQAMTEALKRLSRSRQQG